MERARFWLRLSYWMGALVDVAFALVMFSPPLFSYFYAVPLEKITPPTRMVMLMAACFFLGWSILMLWADRKPLQRRGVLMISVIPVMAGLAVVSVLAVLSGLVPLFNMIPTWVLLGLSILLFANAYLIAQRSDRNYRLYVG